MSGGSRMTRVCICEASAPYSLELHVPQLFCPVCTPWPATTQKAAMGEPLLGSWKAQRVLQEIRAFAQPKDWYWGERMGTHSFRRGAARAVLGAGGSLSKLLRSGQWHSSAYQPYVDLGRVGNRAVASLLIEASDGDWRARHQ